MCFINNFTIFVGKYQLYPLILLLFIMKRLISSLFLIVLLFSSCQKMSFDENEVGSESRTKCMTFRFGGFTMTGIEEIQNDDPDSEESRAATNQTNYSDNLLLGIFDMDGCLIDSIQYQYKKDTNTNYGTFTHTLKYGKYTVLAIGWNGEQQCHVHSLDSICFSEKWVPNTFLCRQNFIVNDSYSDTRTLVLKRCVARFMLSFKDEIIPSDLDKFTMDISGAGNTLNSGTRHCSKIETYQRVIDVDIAPSLVKSISSFCFLPLDSAGVNIDVVAYNKDGDTISSKSFSNVPMKINYSTNFIGNFYNFASGTDEITFATDFDGEFVHEF